MSKCNLGSVGNLPFSLFVNIKRCFFVLILHWRWKGKKHLGQEIMARVEDAIWNLAEVPRREGAAKDAIHISQLQIKIKGEVILEVVVNGKDEYDFRGNILTSPMRQWYHMLIKSRQISSRKSKDEWKSKWCSWVNFLVMLIKKKLIF